MRQRTPLALIAAVCVAAGLLDMSVKALQRSGREPFATYGYTMVSLVIAGVIGSIVIIEVGRWLRAKLRSRHDAL